MQITCSQCSIPFECSEADLAILQKVSPVLGEHTYAIPPPKLCPSCRMQRRLAFRNQQTLYKRTCDKTNKPIVSIYSPDKDQVVYSPTAWWADGWNALDYGRDIDWDRPFLEQFKELMRAVPHIGVLLSNAQNSEYTNQSYNVKDCYLSSAIKDCESVFYCQNVNKVTDSTDSSYCFTSELLYQCTDCYDSYSCTDAYHCMNCSDCIAVFDCVGCKNCFGCVGLRQQQYAFFNETLSKDEYEKRIAEYALHTHEGLEKARADFRAFLAKTEHQTTFMLHCEAVTGNNIRNSRNCTECYDCLDLEDCHHSTWIFGCKDSMDCYGMGESQVAYDCVGVEEVQQIAFSFGTSNSHDCYYTDLCFSCAHCFGCVGLRNKKYCIFNKEYSPEQYEELAGKLIKKMDSEGVWGEFFPVSISAFAYNESKAHELYPLTKEEVLAKGFTWKDDIDEVPQVEKIIPGSRLPSNIDDIPDDILNWAVECQETNRPYRITKGELAFYRQRRLSVPRIHQDKRLQKRMELH